MCLECSAIFSNSSHPLVKFNYLLSIILCIPLCCFEFSLPLVIPASVFLFNFMRHSLNPAHFQSSWVISTTVWHTRFTIFSYLSVFILTCLSLPSYVSPPSLCLFLPQEMSGKPLGFSPPHIKLIPIELLKCHPHNKGPCFIGVCQARREAGFDMTWQEGKEGRGEKWRGKEERVEQQTYVDNIRHVDFSFDMVFVGFEGVCFTNCLLQN